MTGIRVGYPGTAVSVHLACRSCSSLAPRLRRARPGRGHPERPQRLVAGDGGRAVRAGQRARVPARPATEREIERVHTPTYVGAERASAAAAVGTSTPTRPRSRPRGRRRVAGGGCRPGRHRAAGGGGGDGRAPAQCARPATTPCRPGRWGSACSTTWRWRPRRWRSGASGCCWSTTTLTTATARRTPLLRQAGDLRVVPPVAAVPGHGVGAGDRRRRGLGRTVNVPVPPGATGDGLLAAIEEVAAPLAAEIGATWLLLSAGFDAHRADPLTELALTSGDYADMTADLRRAGRAGARAGVPGGRLRPGGAAGLDGGRAGALAGERVHIEPPSGVPGARRHRSGGAGPPAGHKRLIRPADPPGPAADPVGAWPVDPGRLQPVLDEVRPLADRFTRPATPSTSWGASSGDLLLGRLRLTRTST